jgi:hypothetical protein
VPPIPTNLTPVTVYYEGGAGCPVTAVSATVQRDAHVIQVRLSFSAECIISPADQWHIAVPLGALEPGNYEIRAESRGKHTPNLPAISVRVLDATSFPMSPPGYDLNGSERVGLPRAPFFWTYYEGRLGPCETLIYQGAVEVVGCTRTPGLVDIELESDDGDQIKARNAFAFYDSLTGAGREFVFEDVLVPIQYNGLGATGDWRSELSLRAMDSANPADSIVVLAPDSSPFRADAQARVFRMPNRVEGYFVRVARNGVERLRPTLRVWNASVEGVTPTRLPLVRERDWLAGNSRVDAFPLAAGTRVTVRAYSPEDSLHVRTVRGTMFSDLRFGPRSADGPRFTAYEFVTDASGFPQMMFAGEPFGARYWVMITYTDARNGQVVVVTPQPELSRL